MQGSLATARQVRAQDVEVVAPPALPAATETAGPARIAAARTRARPRRSGARTRTAAPATTDVPAAIADAARKLGAVKKAETVERCLRCNAEMEWRHGTWQCPRCRFKLGCCEGERPND